MITLRGAALSYGERTLWRGLDLDVRPGEFLAVVGSNGSGKTSLLRVLLGLQRLSSGTVAVNGRRPRRGSDIVGYVPQHRVVPPHTPLRARDLVRLGIDGHRWGPWRPRRDARRRVDAVLADVGAAAFADVPLELLSGGELQRVRIAQAWPPARASSCATNRWPPWTPSTSASSPGWWTAAAATTASPWCSSRTRSTRSSLSPTGSWT